MVVSGWMHSVALGKDVDSPKNAVKVYELCARDGIGSGKNHLAFSHHNQKCGCQNRFRNCHE